MALIADLLTGRFFKFRLASQADVLAGTSDKHIVTPKSLKDAGLLNPPAAGNMKYFISFLLEQSFCTLATYYCPGTLHGIWPVWPMGRAPVDVRFNVWVNVDPGVVGEVWLWDFVNNYPVAGSSVSVNSTTPILIESGGFQITPGRIYTYAIRRVSPTNGRIFFRSGVLIAQ